MKILAIDTSTEACSAALKIDDEIQLQFEIAPQQHSRLILEQCDKLLAEAGLKPSQLDLVAFGQGPGSFTGLRIAAGVTQGIAFASDLPVAGISTLAAQAQKICTLHPDDFYFSTIDARMKEIYWGLYKMTNNGLVELQNEEAVSSALEIKPIQIESLIGIGSGWKEYQPELESAFKFNKIKHLYPNNLPSAEEIALLAADKLERGHILNAEKAIPVYLRNDVAKKSQKTVN